MSRNQILLITLLLGKAADAIMTKVSGMDEVQVKAAIDVEASKSDTLLAEMRSL